MKKEPQTPIRWQFDEKMIKASKKEWQTHRLTNFNEKIQLLLSKSLMQSSFDQVDTDQYIVKDPAYVAPHLKVGLGVINPVILTVGDPFRCEQVAAQCSESKEVQWNREYRMFNVKYNDQDLTVCSHGIGGPGAAICFEELIKLGAQTIIRLGTCGSLQPTRIKQGHLIVSTGACREDGHSPWMVPSGFPAVSDPRLSLSLYDEAKKAGHIVHMGVNLTSGNFYPGPAMSGTLQVNADAGALSVEMENATLFCIGSVRGIRTAAMGTIDGSPFNWEAGDYDPHGKVVAEGKKNMIRCGLIVASNVAAEDKVQEKDDLSRLEKEAKQIFSDELCTKYLKIFNEKNLYDHVMSQELIDESHQRQILKLANLGVQSNLQFFAENQTELQEEEIEEIIVLYHKIQRGKDIEFADKYLALELEFKSQKSEDGDEKPGH